MSDFELECLREENRDNKLLIATQAAQLSEAREQIERLKEVWFVADQTLGCAFCGWIDWPGANGETDNTTKPHSDECPVGYMVNNWKREVASRDAQLATLREATQRLASFWRREIAYQERHALVGLQTDALRCCADQLEHELAAAPSPERSDSE